jgi:hypothetical protein
MWGAFLLGSVAKCQHILQNIEKLFARDPRRRVRGANFYDLTAPGPPVS